MRTLGKAAVAMILFLPAAFGWSGETHRRMCAAISDALELPAELAEGCLYPDIKGDFQNHICYSDWCPAGRKARIHLEAGRNLWLENRGNDAAFQWGVACHYLSDSLQPYHTQHSNSKEHLEFEGIRPDLQEPAETTSGFEELNRRARDALRLINESSAAAIAGGFANNAMNLCLSMIKNEMSNSSMAEIPDCSSVEKMLLNQGCDMRDVKVTGKIRNPVSRVSKAGNEYANFYLSDGRKNIKAFMFGSLPLKDGSLAEVEGTYYKERKNGDYWFYNEIDAASVRESGTLYAGAAVLLAVAGIVALILLRKVF